MSTEDTDEVQKKSPPPTWVRLGKTLLEWTGTLVAVAAVWWLIGWTRAPDLPTAAPDFSLPDLAGEDVQLSALRGQTVVLNFWATWCGPCRMEIPGLSKFANANPDIPVLGIAVDGSAPSLKQAIKQFGIDYPVLVADGSTIQQDYQVHTLPTTIIVDPDGQIRTAHTGIMVRPHLWLITR